MTSLALARRWTIRSANGLRELGFWFQREDEERKEWDVA
jgi:hypothetical protein